MVCSTEDSNSAIANITAALHLLEDELVLANGGTFEEFQAVAARRWEGAPLEDDSAPASCRTVRVP